MEEAEVVVNNDKKLPDYFSMLRTSAVRGEKELKESALQRLSARQSRERASTGVYLD